MTIHHPRSTKARAGAVLLLLAALFGWTGCSRTTSSNEPGKTRLSLFAMIEAGTVGARIFDQMVNDFQQQHPDLDLVIETLPHEAYHNKLQAMAVARQLPDVVYLWPGKRTGHVTEAGLIQDLTPYIDPIRDQFIPFALAPQGRNGEIWELPAHITSTHIVFANDRMLEEYGLAYPESFEELLRQSEALIAKGIIPIAMGNRAGWPLQSCLMSTLTERACGNEWYAKALRGDGAAFTDPCFIHALSLLKTMADQKVFIHGMNQMDRTQAAELFLQEKAAFYIEGNWRIPDFIKTLTNQQKQYISLHPFPDIPGQKGNSHSHSAAPGAGFGMNRDLSGARADAAWAWIAYYAGPECARSRLASGEAPSLAIHAPENLDPLAAKLLSYFENHPTGPILDNDLDAESMNRLNPLLQELTMGNKNPEEVAAEFEAWVAAHDANRQQNQ